MRQLISHEKIDAAVRSKWDAFLEDMTPDELASTGPRLVLMQEVLHTLNSLPNVGLFSRVGLQLGNAISADLRKAKASLDDQLTWLSAKVMANTAPLTEQQIHDLIREVQRINMLSSALTLFRKSADYAGKLDDLISTVLTEVTSGNFETTEALFGEANFYKPRNLVIPSRLSCHRDVWQMCPQGHAVMRSECPRDVCPFCEKEEIEEERKGNSPKHRSASVLRNSDRNGQLSRGTAGQGGQVRNDQQRGKSKKRKRKKRPRKHGGRQHLKYTR